MILRNELYRILNISCGEGEFCCSMELNNDSVIYKAHFPDNPITPGACMMQMLQEITEEAIGKKLELARLSNVKFLMPLSPKTTTTIQANCKYAQVDGGLKVQATFAGNDVVYAKMSMYYINIQ